MAPYLQPKNLQEIVYAQIAKDILSKYPLEEGQGALQYKDSPCTSYRNLPMPIPSRLLTQIQTEQKCISRDEDLKLTKYIFDQLMTFDTQQLIIKLPLRNKCEEFSRILQILASEGRNLRKLHFVQGNLPPDVIGHFREQDLSTLAVLFGNASQLVHLQIQYQCTDDLLMIIGEQCHNLKILQVPIGLISDMGIHRLTQRIVFEQAAGVNNDWESKIWQINGLYPSMSKFVSKELVTRVHEHPNEQIHMVRDRTPLCITLLEIDITGTNVTHKGLFALLELVPNLETVGDRLNVEFLEKVYSIWNSTVDFIKMPKPTLKIQNLCLKDKPLSPNALEVLKKLCPDVRRLCCTLPVNITLVNLTYLTKVQYLNCTKKSIPHSTNNNAVNFSPEKQDIKDYVGICGHQLKELTLTFPKVDELNLHTILENSPNLEELHISINKFIIWDGLFRHMCLWHLTNVSLSKCVMAFAAVNLFKAVPNVREVNIECIWDNMVIHILSLGDAIINHTHLQKLVVGGMQVKPLSECMKAILQSNNGHVGHTD